MASEERKFEQVLDSLAKKEKRAQRRATLLTVLTLIVGLLLMAGFSWQVVRLRKTRAELEQDVRDLNTKKAEAIKDLDKTKSDLADAKKKADEETQKVEEARKGFEEITKNLKAGRRDEALRIASKGIKPPIDSQRGRDESQTSQFTRPYDGDLSLTELSVTIEVEEKNSRAQCVALTARGNTGATVNIATFRRVSISEELGSITIVPVNAAGRVPGKRSFESNIFVEGAIMRVALVRMRF